MFDEATSAASIDEEFTEKVNASYISNGFKKEILASDLLEPGDQQSDTEALDDLVFKLTHHKNPGAHQVLQGVSSEERGDGLPDEYLTLKQIVN